MTALTPRQAMQVQRMEQEFSGHLEDYRLLPAPFRSNLDELWTGLVTPLDLSHPSEGELTSMTILLQLAVLLDHHPVDRFHPFVTTLLMSNLERALGLELVGVSPEAVAGLARLGSAFGPALAEYGQADEAVRTSGEDSWQDVLRVVEPRVPHEALVVTVRTLLEVGSWVEEQGNQMAATYTSLLALHLLERQLTHLK